MTTPEDPSDPPFGWQPPADQPPADQPPAGPPPPPYGSPPPAYGAPPPGYGTPPPAYGAPPPGYGTPPGYGQPPPYQGGPGYQAAVGPQFGGHELAAWGWRVLGFIIDWLIVVIPSVILGLATGSRFVYDIIAIIGALVIGYLNGAQGQSPGKRAVGLKVLRESDGQLLGGGMGIVRLIAHFLDSFACLIGWLWPLWDSKRQTFADKIVGTVVIKV
jgi:uncharacterized RDD family membrane protein YckC